MKFKFSVMTIITLVALILSIVFFGGLTLYTIFSIITTKAQGYGWLFFIVMISALLVIPYYGAIFIASYMCDRKIKKNIVLKNIIIVFFLLLPFLWLGKLLIEADIDSKKLDYDYGDVSIKFPEDMKRGSTGRDFDGKYTNVEFYKDRCSIRFSVDKYDDNLSLIENFKEKSDRFTIIKNSPNTIYEDFDLNYSLGYKDISNKFWNSYEKEYTGMKYTMYGIKINNNFYKIEIENTSDNDDLLCNDLVNKTLDTVKYK